MLNHRLGFIGLAIAALGLTLGLALGFAHQPQLDALQFLAAPGESSQSRDTTQMLPTASVERANLQATVTTLVAPRHTAGDRDRLRQQLTATLTELGWQVTPQTFATGTNLIATRPQDPPFAPPDPVTDAPAQVILGAHYDTVTASPGADDNASAIAVLLEVARLSRDQPTARPITLAFFDQEEAGLLGSQAFAASPSVTADSVQIALILDMVGYTCATAGCQQYPEQIPAVFKQRDRGDFLAAISGWQQQPVLQALVKTGAVPIEPLGLPLQVAPPDLLRSDHAPFWEKDIPAVLLTDTANFRNPHYHQPTDTPDTLDWDFLTGVTQAVLQTALTLANS